MLSPTVRLLAFLAGLAVVVMHTLAGGALADSGSPLGSPHVLIAATASATELVATPATAHATPAPAQAPSSPQPGHDNGLAEGCIAALVALALLWFSLGATRRRTLVAALRSQWSNPAAPRSWVPPQGALSLRLCVSLT